MKMEDKIYVIGCVAEQVSTELVQRIIKEKDFSGEVVFIESEKDIPFGTPSMQRIDFPIMKLTCPERYIENTDFYKPRKGKDSWKSPYIFHK